MGFNYQVERRLFEAAQREARRTGRNQYLADFREGLRSGGIDAKRLSIRHLFESFVPDGRELVDSWNPRSAADQAGVRLHEAAVETSAFSNITGQIFYNQVLEYFENPQLIGNRLVETVPTNLDGEKIAGVSLLSDDIETVGENKDYPTAGVSEDWVETPRTTKRGVIVPVTREAIFFDRTGQLLRHCSQVAEVMALNKEKRILDAVLGEVSSYNRKDRGVVATYGNNAGDHDFDNLQASNALADYTDIENARLLFDGMTDPNTGEPIIVGPSMQIIVPTALQVTAARIIAATEYRAVNSSNTTLSGNPLQYMPLNFSVESSAYVKDRTSSTTTWFIGDFPRGFKYMENWGPTVIEAPPNSHEEFRRDVVAQYKITERGVAAVVEPRVAVKCTA